MKIENLHVKQTFKNYKDLCSALGEIPKTSNSKKAQVKEWERYFRFSRNGHKYIIEEIFESLKEKKDLRSQGNNASAYIDEIEELILNLLGQDYNHGQLFLSKSKLLKELKMINDNYTYYRSRKPTLSKFTNIHIEEINDFYESSINTFKSNLETALNRLQKQSLIYWTYALTVCYVSTYIETTATGHIKATKRKYTNEYGETVTKFNTVLPSQTVRYRKATEDEIRIIIEIERELLKKYKCKDKSEVYRNGKIQDFYDDVNAILFDKTNIVYYYNSYEILFNERHIKEKLEELKLLDTYKEVTEKTLNNGIIEKLAINAQKRFNKANEEFLMNMIDDYYEPSEKIQLRSNDDYIEHNVILSETLINKDYPSLYK
jgi:hypothetical protein